MSYCAKLTLYSWTNVQPRNILHQVKMKFILTLCVKYFDEVSFRDDVVDTSADDLLFSAISKTFECTEVLIKI